MRRIIDYLVFLMLVLSSGAIVQLIMEGGARSQGLDSHTPYSGPLNYLPTFWKISVIGLISLAIFIGKRRYFKFDIPWLALLALSFVSALWAEFAKVSFDAVILILLAYLLVNLHVELCGWRRVISLLSKVFMFILLLSIAVIFLLPGYGVAVGEHAGNWQGVFVHKNAFGNFAALTFMFFLWCLTIKNSKWTFVGIGLSAVLVMGSGCTTGLINMVLSTVLFTLLSFSFTRKLLFTWRYAIVVLLAATCVYVLYLSISSSEIALGDKDTSFSARNLIWAYILLQITEAPWVGHGLGQIAAAVVSNDADFLAHVGFVVGSAHNGFLESLHALGAVGLSLIIVVLIKPLRAKRESSEFDLGFLYLLFFVLLNMFESKLLGFNVFFIMLMYVGAVTKAIAEQEKWLTIEKSKLS